MKQKRSEAKDASTQFRRVMWGWPRYSNHPQRFEIIKETEHFITYIDAVSSREVRFKKEGLFHVDLYPTMLEALMAKRARLVAARDDLKARAALANDQALEVQRQINAEQFTAVSNAAEKSEGASS